MRTNQITELPGENNEPVPADGNRVTEPRPAAVEITSFNGFRKSRRVVGCDSGRHIPVGVTSSDPAGTCSTDTIGKNIANPSAVTSSFRTPAYNGLRSPIHTMRFAMSAAIGSQQAPVNLAVNLST